MCINLEKISDFFEKMKILDELRKKEIRFNEDVMLSPITYKEIYEPQEKILEIDLELKKADQKRVYAFEKKLEEAFY